MMTPLRLPRIGSDWQNNPAYFTRIWNTAMQSIEDTVNGVIIAQTAADEALLNAATAQSTADTAQTTANTAITNAATAQTTANTAVTNAATAQSTANAAQSSANTKVPKNNGPAWSNSTGTADRTAYPSYLGQTVSNPPTQAQVQQIDDALKVLSQHVVAIINDLKANGALT